MARHKDGGWRCSVAHFITHEDGEIKYLPPCIKCGRCGEWVRPEELNKECEGAGIPVVVP